MTATGRIAGLFIQWSMRINSLSTLVMPAVIELVVGRIADRARRRGMADQRNMPVGAQGGPCGGAVVGGIGCAACHHERDEKRDLDRVDHAAF